MAFVFSKKFLALIVLVGALLGYVYSSDTANAQSEAEKLQQLQNQIKEYEAEVSRLKSEANTLSNQIAQFDAQIRLTELQIDQTNEKISELGGRINQLGASIESLTEAFNSRVIKTYKMTRLQDPYLMLVTSTDLSGSVSSYHYLQRIQEADRDLLERLETAKTRYTGEKEEQEELQEKLEVYKVSLDSQKAAKANLLAVTRNDEKRYQSLLSQARAEFEAIQAVVAGRGQETEVGKVAAGQRIASVIQGPSCNSSGAHLHFIVKAGGSVQNPFSYLRSGVSHENCSGSSCGSGDGDSFSPSGSWNWPISETIKFSQGYGSTWATRNTWVSSIYNFHNGIDINNSGNPEVKAVEAGTLYQGSYSGGGGCRLRYVRVDHDGSDAETFYLHINY